MRQAALIAVGFLLAFSGMYLAGSASSTALAARKALVSELSSTLGRARTLDTIAQQLKVESGSGASAQQLLTAGLQSARLPAERASLEAALDCARDGGCGDPTAVLAPAHAALEASINQQWADVDQAEKPMRRSLQWGLGLVLLGVLFAAASGATTARPPVKAAPLDTHAMEDVLRERLEALYAAHSQLDDNARFAAFGELAAALSHGLKTPLAGVQASVQLAQLKLGEQNAAREELDEVVRLTEGLTEQVQRFLRAAGQVGPTRQRLELGALLGVLEKAYAEESKRRGITFTVKKPEGSLAVDADASLLDMAVRNLVENALAVVKGGQAVTVSAEPCAAPTRVGLEGQAPAAGAAYCALVVDDEGPGLPEAARRTQAGATTRESGSGLGLAIARRVAERHDGALALEDRPGGGTRIRVVLPLAAAGRAR